jgi:hypothetical protein
MCVAMAAGELCFMTASVVGCECRNCEDIAMSFLVANATSAPPLWVKGNSLLCSYLQFTFHFGICCFAPVYSVLSILEFAALLLFIVYFPFWLLSNSLFYGFEFYVIKLCK